MSPAHPPLDSDGDGLPDDWENAHGLDPADGADHGTVAEPGYMAIEEYCHELAAELANRWAGPE